MTIDEAINFYEKQTEKLYKAIPCDGCPFDKCKEEHRQLVEWLRELKELREQTRWIPCSERLPEDLEPVNITWVNHNPESYYLSIKDKSFTATGVYFNGQWYWWSALCADTLATYRHNYDDIIDDDIEITAWKPLPEPYVSEINNRKMNANKLDEGDDCMFGDYMSPIV